MINTNKIIYPVIAILFLFSFLGYICFDQINKIILKSIDTAEIATSLLSIVMIATFIERAIEVILNTDPTAKILKRNIDRLNEDQRHLKVEMSQITGGENLKQALDTRYLENLAALKEEREKTAESRHQEKMKRSGISLIIAVLLGGAAAFVGFRVLGIFIDMSSLPDTCIKALCCPKKLVTIFDVFISATVIAGGASGIHMLASKLKDIFSPGT